MAKSLPFLARPPNKVFSFIALCPQPFKIRPLDPPPFRFPASTLKFLETHYSSSLNLTTHFNNNKGDYIESTFKPDKFYASLIDDSIHKIHLNQIYAKCYSRHGFFGHAIEMYARMQVACVSPDGFSFPCVLKACSALPALEMGRRVENPSLIFWNAMISGYVKNGYAEEAIELFRLMKSKNIRPDSITVTSSIAACAQIGSLELARWMDEYISMSEFRNDVIVNTSLIDTYAKCGSVDMARFVFDRIPDKDVVVWSAMMVGYGLHGQGRESIILFHAMRQAGVSPNDVTFVGLLTACKNSGLVEEGWDLFHRMGDYGIEPRHQHYACVVDLLGRAGVSVWGALLSACKIHRHVTLGEYAAEQLFSLDPYNTGHYVQLSNLYASSRLWDCVAKVRVLMREKGLTKHLGYSVIEINGKLQVFQAGDKTHPRSKEIFEEVEDLERRLKEAGFVPHTESVLHDLNYEETEETLYCTLGRWFPVMLHLTDNHSIKSPKFKVATTLFHPMWNCVCLMLCKRKGGKKSIQLSAKKKCFHKVQPHADESSSYIQYLLIRPGGLVNSLGWVLMVGGSGTRKSG
ncbi:hypothetical protein D5086_025141 [Populus alba]|uniref:Uncharacterized protein n=1 Tax=Populus alba TaxID=43335 RepID=A0ACC4B7G4_POPAL